MLTFEEAGPAADDLRTRAELERTQLGGLLTLVIAAACSYSFPRKASLPYFLFVMLLLVLGPLVLPRVLPKGNLLAYRAAIFAYPIEGLLLGFIAFMEIWKILPLDVPELPTLNAVLPWLSVLLPVFYYVQQFPNWKRRLQRYKLHEEQLSRQINPLHESQLRELLQPALDRRPQYDDPWAEFTSVPATPNHWKLYMQLDSEFHGDWRVAFNGPWALVAFEDGTRVEAVRRGHLKIVADDPQPGKRKALCLVRWNKNLFEGRISHDNFLKIHAWNASTGDGSESKPPPGDETRALTQPETLPVDLEEPSEP